MANRTNCFFKVACLAVIFTAVMRAGITAFGAYAVRIGMGMWLYGTTAINAEVVLLVFSGIMHIPQVVVRGINVLSVAVKEHVAVCTEAADRLIFPFCSAIAISNTVTEFRRR